MRLGERILELQGEDFAPKFIEMGGHVYAGMNLTLASEDTARQQAAQCRSLCALRCVEVCDLRSRRRSTMRLWDQLEAEEGSRRAS